MKIKDLIENLSNKDQEQDVEFFIVGKDGKVVTIHLEKQLNNIVNLLKGFTSWTKP